MKKSTNSNLLFDANKKAVNEIFINRIAKRNYAFTQTEKLFIDNLASQCAYSSGYSVFEARAMQKHWNDTAGFNDKQLCYQPVQQLKTSQSLNEGNKFYDFKVIPNPATDFLIIYSMNFGKDYHVRITDITGKIYTDIQLLSEQNYFTINNLENGFYFIHLLRNRYIVSTEQFVIVK